MILYWVHEQQETVWRSDGRAMGAVGAADRGGAAAGQDTAARAAAHG